ncbi:MAG: transcription termination factor NusA, partial [Gaiellaceae bacterium]
AIGKEGLNARLAARLTGWRVDIQSDTEFAHAEAEAAYGGGDDEEFTGRCSAVLSNGKRCPNAALPGSKYCGVPAHQELALHEPEEGTVTALIEEAATVEEVEELEPVASTVDAAPEGDERDEDASAFETATAEVSAAPAEESREEDERAV